VTSDEQLTESLEMYLKSIYLIAQKKGAARVKDIALDLGVINASVTGALKQLAKKELINYAPYDLVTLTPKGTSIALSIINKYKTLREFFIMVLGIDPELAEEEACKMEHRLRAKSQ